MEARRFLASWKADLDGSTHAQQVNAVPCTGQALYARSTQHMGLLTSVL